MDGILLVDKPRGWTSFDVVNYVRKILAQAQGKKPKQVKVGHTGTLDPMATGLLVLLIGTYTKKAPELSKLDKTYEVTMRLGVTSSTGDSEGIITPYRRSHLASHPERSEGSIKEKRSFASAQDDVTKPAQKELELALQKFVGEIWQTPPAFSAIKIGGQRAYKLARAGKEVKLEPRKVRVESVELRVYKYPEVKFTAKVSSGTYIRSLVEDLGQELGVGAYMSDLRRTQVGEFNLKDALKVESLTAEQIYGNLD